MSDRETQAVAEEVLALLQACLDDLDDCRIQMRAIKASLGRTIRTGSEVDTKMARMESDLLRIRCHFDSLPDHAVPGRAR